jgi:hypothetical protein
MEHNNIVLDSLWDIPGLSRDGYDRVYYEGKLVGTSGPLITHVQREQRLNSKLTKKEAVLTILTLLKYIRHDRPRNTYLEQEVPGDDGGEVRGSPGGQTSE